MMYIYVQMQEFNQKMVLNKCQTAMPSYGTVKYLI